ncbi:hypothetical protein I4U23_010304 [Adineta vaga]|nr:hypothetical protein I4U23_010304 [Adineta vaga]
MNTAYYPDKPPSYPQVLAPSHESIHHSSAPYVQQIPVVTAVGIRFGNRSIAMNCPYCRNAITTVIEEENGALIYLLCILIALFG